MNDSLSFNLAALKEKYTNLGFYFSNLDFTLHDIVFLIIWIQIRHIEPASFYLISECVCIIKRMFHYFQETVSFQLSNSKNPKFKFPIKFTLQLNQSWLEVTCYLHIPEECFLIRSLSIYQSSKLLFSYVAK